MSIDAALLAKFCSSDATRPLLNEPFNFMDHTWASDGVILIRTPFFPGYQDHDGEKYNLALILNVFSTKSEDLAQSEDVPPMTIDLEDCKYCSGNGQVWVCPECEGEGCVSPKTDFNTYDDVECLSCGGDGYVFQEKAVRMVGPEHAKAISCAACGGLGQTYPENVVSIGGAYYGAKYVHLLSLLPGCKIRANAKHPDKPSLFTFDGGDGLLMPRRKTI